MADGTYIDLAKAVQLTTYFRTLEPVLLAAPYVGLDVLPVCETFDKALLNNLINETPGCAQVRIYLGMDAEDQICLVICGVDSEGKDMLPKTGSPAGTSPVIIEGGNRNPPNGVPVSPLNS